METTQTTTTKETDTMSNQIYSLDTDAHVVRIGEIAVELHEHTADGDPLPLTFARFRSPIRAEKFAARSRSNTCRVKAWRVVSDDQTQKLDL
jgi:hypothetical protein